MSYPLNHNARGLAAIVVFFDLTGAEVFRYEMPSLAVTPVQNFPFTGVDLNFGINENHGAILVYIDDRDNNFTENIGGDIRSKFKSGWTVKIFCGKEPASVNLWALGVLQDVDLNYQTNLFNQTIICFGYGIRTQHRLSIMKRSQERLESDAITPDPADTTTHVSELFKDVLTDIDHLAAQGLGQLDITTGNVNDIPIPIAEFDKNIVTFASILSELAIMGFAWWGVDQNKVAFLYKRGEVSSGFLVSNDTSPEPNDTANWNADKRMFFRNFPNTIHDLTSDSAFSILQAVGAQRLTVDHNEQAYDADIDTNNKINAFKFVPVVDNVAQITVQMASVSPITSDLVVSIVGESGGNPNLANVRKTVTINHAQLDKELDAAGKQFKIRFDKIPVTKGEILFVVFSQTNNVGLNALTLAYQSTSGNFYQSEDGGASWTTPPGEPAFITYNSKNTRIIAESATTIDNLLPKEAIVNLPDTPTEQTVFQILESMLETLTKVIRNYEPIIVSPPTIPPELGKSIRLLDVKLNIDTEVDLIGYSLSINALDNSNRGATNMTLNFQGIYI